MSKDYINKLAAEAQKKFEEAKNLILQEFEVAINKAEEAAEETAAAKAISDFVQQLFDSEETEPECKCDLCGECDCSCDEEDDELTWINHDLIDFNEDYKLIDILIQEGADGEMKIAVAHDRDMDQNIVPVFMSKAIVETIWEDENIRNGVSKEELNEIFEDGLLKSLLKLLFKGMSNIIAKAGEEE